MATLVGIDIGHSAVKVAVVRSSYRKVSLEAIVKVEIDDTAAPGLTIANAVKAALGGTLTSDGVAVAIEGARAAVRTIPLPASAQKQLADVLPFELEAQVPFDMGESVFDYKVLPRAMKDGVEGATIDVLVAVARAVDVRARIDLVKGALGLEPERVGVGAFPLANLAPFTEKLGEEGPVAIVDLGASTSEVLLLEKGEPVFARTLSFGTNGLPGTAPRLAREIRVSIAAYRSLGGAEPARVYMCGDGAYMKGAGGFLAGELGLPVEELPSLTIELGNVAPENVRELPRFSKAIGLALGLSGRGAGLDLRKGPLAYERGFAWVREKVPALAGLVAVIFVSFFFSAWAELHAGSNDRVTLETALGLVTKDVLGEETTSAARANELLGQQTAVTDEDPMPHADAFDVMVKLSEDIPVSMTHDIEELDVQKAHVIIHGIVGTIPDAQSIASSLRNEKCFADVKITRTNQVVGGERQKYVLEFDEKCPEDLKSSKKKDVPSGSATSASSGGGK